MTQEQDAAVVTGAGAQDVRDEVEFTVLLANGRLAGRRFAGRADAEAWAHPELGDEVVELSLVCDCDR